jgi:hypothetical protein
MNAENLNGREANNNHQRTPVAMPLYYAIYCKPTQRKTIPDAHVQFVIDDIRSCIRLSFAWQLRRCSKSTLLMRQPL